MFGLSKKEKFFDAVMKKDKTQLNSLLEKGVNIDIQNRDGETALMIACQDGDFEFVKFLIDKGSNLNLKSNSENFALLIAARNKQVGIVKILIEPILHDLALKNKTKHKKAQSVIDILKEEDKIVRKIVIRALGRLNNSTAEAVIAEFEESMRDEAAEWRLQKQKAMRDAEDYQVRKEQTSPYFSIMLGCVIKHKYCGWCSRIVDFRAKANTTCPICGAYWTDEESILPGSHSAPQHRKRCDRCHTEVSIEARVGEKCPACGAIWGVKKASLIAVYEKR